MPVWTYIDEADLRLALEDAEAQLSNAQAQVALENAEQQRARSEYESFGRQLSAERRSLVLREPQLESGPCPTYSGTCDTRLRQR